MKNNVGFFSESIENIVKHKSCACVSVNVIHDRGYARVLVLVFNSKKTINEKKISLFTPWARTFVYCRMRTKFFEVNGRCHITCDGHSERPMHLTHF